MFKTIIAALAFTFFAAGAAVAGDAPLTEDQAKRFVKTLPALEALKNEMDEEGKSEHMNVATRPKAGEPFKPYSNAVAALKKDFPADHARLAKAVKPFGFTAAEWGNVGDRVMIAHMANKMQNEDPRTMAMMENMDPSMIDMMPPEMRDQLASTFAMMETVKNAPAEDREVVAKVGDELDAYMENETPS